MCLSISIFSVPLLYGLLPPLSPPPPTPLYLSAVSLSLTGVAGGMGLSTVPVHSSPQLCLCLAAPTVPVLSGALRFEAVPRPRKVA